jgi:hypothetical protein
VPIHYTFGVVLSANSGRNWFIKSTSARGRTSPSASTSTALTRSRGCRSARPFENCTCSRSRSRSTRYVHCRVTRWVCEKMKKFLQTHPPITKAIRFFTLYLWKNSRTDFLCGFFCESFNLCGNSAENPFLMKWKIGRLYDWVSLCFFRYRFTIII